MISNRCALFSLVLVAFSFSDGNEARADCPGDAVGCAEAALHYEGWLGNEMSSGVDTGWFPPSSPIQIRAFVLVSGQTNVALDTAPTAHWPDPITISIPPAASGGTALSLDYGFHIGLKVRIGVTVLGEYIGGEFDIPIPNLPSDLAFQAITRARGLVLEGDPERPLSVSDSIAPITIARYDVLGSVIPIPGVSGAIELAAQGTMSSSYRTDSVSLENGGQIVRADGTFVVPPPSPEGYGASLFTYLTPRGTITQRFTISLIPRLRISFFDVVQYDIDIANLPIPIANQERAFTFHRAPISFSLPDVALGRVPLAFPAVDVGSTSAASLLIRNDGFAELTIDVDQVPPGFESFSTGLSIPAKSSASLPLFFFAETASSRADTLVLLTNDPDSPELRVPLFGRVNAPIAPEEPALSDAGVVDIGDAGVGDASVLAQGTLAGGAGCSTRSGSSSPTLCLVAVALFAAKRRRRC